MARRRTSCRLRKRYIISALLSWTLAGLIRFKYIDINVLFTHPWTIQLGIALIWIGEKMLHGVLVFVFFTALAALFSAICHIHRRRATSPDEIPTPAALERGSTEDSTPTWEPGAACKLFYFIIATLLFAAYIHTFQHDLVDPSQPFLENVGACLMFGVRGLEIVFILALVIRLGIWVQDICFPHVGEGVELEPDEAQSMKESSERKAADTSAAAVGEAAVPPQPIPCIGIDPSADIPHTEEQAEEVAKIALERGGCDS